MKILKNSNAWKKKYDLTGKKFGLLKVIKFLGFKKLYDKGSKRRSHFLCRCKCKKEKVVAGIKLNNGQIKSCGFCLIHPKYKIDEKFFEKINREDKAYLFGFLLTDGTIDGNKKHKRIVLNLDIKDKHILETFKKYLKTTKPIAYTKRKERKYKYHTYPAREYGTLTISNSKMHRDIIKLGLKPNKTKTVKFPTNKIIPHKFMRHFIRGVFDGDGTCGKSKNTRVVSIISGSKNFIIGFKEYLKRFGIFNIGITAYKRQIASGFSYSWNLSIYPSVKKYIRGNIVAENQKNFFNLIYRNCMNDLYLKRKKTKFISIMK